MCDFLYFNDLFSLPPDFIERFSTSFLSYFFQHRMIVAVTTKTISRLSTVIALYLPIFFCQLLLLSYSTNVAYVRIFKCLKDLQLRTVISQSLLPSLSLFAPCGLCEHIHVIEQLQLMFLIVLRYLPKYIIAVQINYYLAKRWLNVYAENRKVIEFVYNKRPKIRRHLNAYFLAFYSVISLLNLGSHTLRTSLLARCYFYEPRDVYCSGIFVVMYLVCSAHLQSSILRK